jgi:hypothetical protein
MFLLERRFCNFKLHFYSKFLTSFVLFRAILWTRSARHWRHYKMWRAYYFRLKTLDCVVTGSALLNHFVIVYVFQTRICLSEKSISQSIVCPCWLCSLENFCVLFARISFSGYVICLLLPCFLLSSFLPSFRSYISRSERLYETRYRVID